MNLTPNYVRKIFYAYSVAYVIGLLIFLYLGTCRYNLNAVILMCLIGQIIVGLGFGTLAAIVQKSLLQSKVVKQNFGNIVELFHPLVALITLILALIIYIAYLLDPPKELNGNIGFLFLGISYSYFYFWLKK